MLTNKEVVIVAMLLATLIMGVIKIFEGIMRKIIFKKRIARTNYLRNLAKENKIPFKLINLDLEPRRLKNTPNNVGIIVDDTIYNDKNAYFLQEDNGIYIIGKKEDFVITLVGGRFNRI